MTTAAKILSALSNAQAEYAEPLAIIAGTSKATAIRHLRALARRGFVFCEDDFDGRRRSRGKYANALWVINCETCGFSIEDAARAIATPGNGHDIMVRDLGCI